MSTYDECLVILEDESGEATCEEADQEFYIYDELQTYDSADAQSIFEELYTADLNSSLSIDVINIIRPRLCDSVGYDKPSLVYGILLCRRLQEYIEENNIKRVTQHNISPFFEMVVMDVCHHMNIKTDITPPKQRLSKLKTYFLILVGIIPFLLDQLFSILLRRVIRTADMAEIVFACGIGRFDSVRPVIEETNRDYKIVATPMTTAWLSIEDIRDTVQDFDILPSNLYSTANTLTSELLFLTVKFPKEFFLRRSLQRDFELFINKEYDVKLEWTIWWMLNHVFTPRLIRSVLSYYVYKTAFSRLECESVITNTLSPTGRAILTAGHSQNLSLYHIPHSIMAPSTTQRPYSTTSFVAGEGEIKYIDNHVDQITDTNQFVATGRPYISELVASRHTYPKKRFNNGSESLLLTVATQPYPTSVRRSLVENIIAGCEEVDDYVSVIIKVHPSEDPDFYDFMKEYDFVRVETGHLFSVLADSDIVFTINSNVGLETQILGTPCVCINQCEPLIWNMPYSDFGPVPVLRSSEEIQSFILNLTNEKIQSYKIAQKNILTQISFLMSSRQSGFAK